MKIMELDNLIYIIITVAIFVFSIFGQFKKRKVQQPVQKDEMLYSLNDFEKILDRKEEFISNEETEPEIVNPEKEESKIHEIKLQEDNKAELKQKNQKEENEINDGFDIKSAIIYSSILERKKFRH
jgi:hypothetical protein